MYTVGNVTAQEKKSMATITHQDLSDSVYLFAINGDLDAPGGLEIKDPLENHLAEHGGKCIIDLSDVTYMSSYGLRVLLTAAKILQDLDGELHLAAPSERVMEVLVTSGYDSLFPVHHSVDDARKILGVA